MGGIGDGCGVGAWGWETWVCTYYTSPVMLRFLVQCSECLQHVVLFPSNYYERN